MSRRRRRNVARVQDGFENIVARVGLGQKNLLAQSGYRRSRGLDRAELEEMYRSSWVVGRMVEVVAEDMVRAGISIQTQMPPEQVDELHRAWQAAGIPGRLADAIKWARLYGGAIAVLLIDGQDLATPLELDSVGQGAFRGLAVLDRHQVTPSQRRITELGPMLGYPAGYRVYGDNGLEGQFIHHSRALRFVGIELPHQLRLTEQGWGASVVERVLDRILALDSATYGSANLMLKSFLRVIQVKDLRRILAQGGPAEKALTKMMAMIGELQSNEGLTLLDAEDSFATHNWSFAGVYDALQAFAEQISGATGIPLIRLLGQSPKGFSTGDADLQTYYETILTAQEDDLRGPVALLLSVLARSLWGTAPPDGLSFTFNPLAAPSALEKSQIATADAQAVAALFGAGIIDEAQALGELRDTGRLTGRFVHIRDEDIEAARAASEAPPIDELTPSEPALEDQDAPQG
ncbi:DUF1073 domain-containing protein [Telmatospirillum sp. J64-1]|uniref:DUF1073 domain-containing protein n=1 Tax=Telmatospirillum sp. J64-1 TaxID=2502183 RepID=UPI00115F0B7C|nr:DUF1073 domain-containing protein [Telmatospirillum sp. J64-1]